MADWKNAKLVAQQVRKKHSLNTTPVNVFDVAAQEGISITYFKPDDETANISGFLVLDEKKIFLNPDESAQRQNFTLAHELAHYFLKHKTNEYGVLWRNSVHAVKPEAEKEADAFAAELLMPKKAIIKIKADYHLDDTDSSILAVLFGVSKMAMDARLRSLKYEKEA